MPIKHIEQQSVLALRHGRQGLVKARTAQLPVSSCKFEIIPSFGSITARALVAGVGNTKGLYDGRQRVA